MEERHAPAGLQQARRPRRGRGVGADAEPVARAPQQRRVADRVGRRHQHQPPGLGRQRLQPLPELCLDLARERRVGQGEAAGQLGQVSPRGSSSSASGLPRVSSTIRSRTLSSSGPRDDGGQQLACVGRAAAHSTTSSGRPVSWSSASRVARISASDSPNTRRATNASVSSEARSSQCASSIDAHQRPLAGDVGEQARAPPARRGSGPAAAPAVSPNAVPSASRCGAGSRDEPVEHRRAQLVQAGERELHLGVDAGGARDAAARTPPARAYSSSADFPTPGSPRSTRTPLRPATARRRARGRSPHTRYGVPSTRISRPRM